MNGENEVQLWQKAQSCQRSHLVQVLHWFHFRPTQLKRSWAKEEVLTWELIRALQILPQGAFARPLVELVSTLSPESARATAALLAANRLSIAAYPILGLNGLKRNCRSDVGFGVEDQPSTVWLEAKTAPFNVETLKEQLNQQRQALTASAKDLPTIVVTLLPDGLVVPGVPNLAWGQVARVLSAGKEALRNRIADMDLRSGYDLVTSELVDRITSHPNRIVSAHSTG